VHGLAFIEPYAATAATPVSGQARGSATASHGLVPRKHWAAHNVRLHRTGLKHMRHPVVGELHLSYDVMELPADPGLSLIAFSAEAGSPDDDALQLLASWPPPTTRPTPNSPRCGDGYQGSGMQLACNYAWRTPGNECTLVHPMPHVRAGTAAVRAVFQTGYAGSIPVARSSLHQAKQMFCVR
jgi:hypothetical protein